MSRPKLTSPAAKSFRRFVASIGTCAASGIAEFAAVVADVIADGAGALASRSSVLVRVHVHEKDDNVAQSSRHRPKHLRRRFDALLLDVLVQEFDHRRVCNESIGAFDEPMSFIWERQELRR